MPTIRNAPAPVSDRDAVSDPAGSDAPTVAVVLAAGAGTRFGDATVHKLAAALDGTALALRAVEAARRARIGIVVVVTGATTPPLPPDDDPHHRLIVVDNPRWAEGQASSLWAGLRTAEELGAHAVVVGLADQPFVTADAWRAVAQATAPIAVATYDGRRGHPVRLHRTIWPMLPDHGDLGARELIRMRPDLVEQVACEGSPVDIDTVEDLERWQKNSSTNSP